MSEIDVFGFIGMNRSIFATFVLCGVLTPLVIVIGYLFRNFSTVVRGGAMVSSLIGVVMLTFFTMSAQNAFMMLTTLSGMAGAGLTSRRIFVISWDAGWKTINQPGWMMALSLVQVIINIVLTIYVFLFAQWESS